MAPTNVCQAIKVAALVAAAQRVKAGALEMKQVPQAMAVQMAAQRAKVELQVRVEILEMKQVPQVKVAP